MEENSIFPWGKEKVPGVTIIFYQEGRSGEETIRRATVSSWGKDPYKGNLVDACVGGVGFSKLGERCYVPDKREKKL